MLDTGLPFNDNCEDVIVGGNALGVPPCRVTFATLPSSPVWIEPLGSRDGGTMRQYNMYINSLMHR